MQHKRHILLGWTAAVFIGLLWGAPWIAGIPLLKSMNSIVLVWLRYIVSIITLFTLLRIGYKKVEIRDYGVNRLIDNKKDFLWTVICGVVGQGAFSFFSFLSLKWISAAENGIIQGLIPMVILIIWSVFFNSRFKLIQIFAVIGAFVGVAILTLNPSDKITGSSIGYLFCFISVLSFASTAHARAKLAKSTAL
ncbi:hypothetical protein fh0823_07380 [Francisella halioticida]|uniref:DMT family transporter n=1 Tax=Francisella halioticida TaxID=549298 RepID=UPI001AF5F8D7|nr:DMT family transporter [Francisella halioticida]BCD90599.1 hypothetical protein fh0823_07380 [Francisella halioticida]